MTRLAEARVQLQRAREAVADDRPELYDSLSELVADVDEIRWLLDGERARSRGHEVDPEEGEEARSE
jgi:hypothetical protein